MFVANKLQTGKKIKEFREQAGLKRKDVAEELGISEQSVGKYERGEMIPDSENAEGLAALFGVSTKDFLIGKLIKIERKRYKC